MDVLYEKSGLTGFEIAMIGMSCRFPGANNVRDFWNNIYNGVESISFFTREELESYGIAKEELNNPNYVKASPIIKDVDLFDGSFFGYTDEEVQVMDPQQRLFLECSWEALENTGYNTSGYNKSIGVYIGTRMNTYVFNIISNPDIVKKLGSIHIGMGNDPALLCARASYKLDLKGPSYTMQTGCSSSLVAVHLACQSLLTDECSMALAGGVAIFIPHKAGYTFQPDGLLSPDGHCRSFDAKAKGTVFGSGVGVVVLKRLEDAIEDRDHIYAIIKGSASNNDGSFRASFTAPSVEGQAKVIAEAQALAGVNPETISYIEAHGTGTAIGDPIEIAALTKAFRMSTDRRRFCAIGSVKTNIGHLDAAAGIAGLIKTALALKHGVIPPSLHYEQPNPQIDFENSPFYVNTKLTEWETQGTPRRAGVSAFGIGGTNAHVILEEAPEIKSSKQTRPWQLLMVSAKTELALEKATDNMAEHLRSNPDNCFADICYTLQVGRKAFDYRRMAVCRDNEEAAGILELRDLKRMLTSKKTMADKPVVFMFSGIGDQYIDMALGLYRTEPVFRKEVDKCSEILKLYLGVDIRDIIYPSRLVQNEEKRQTDGFSQGITKGIDLKRMLHREEEEDEDTQRLNQTYLVQPVLFVIEYGLAALLIKWGIKPDMMIGYSIGEYVAACISGAVPLEDALYLVAKRAQLIEGLPRGAMLAVPLPEEEAESFLEDRLSIGAVNGESLCVVSGEKEIVYALESRLSERGLVCRQLKVSHAFHSVMMGPVRELFMQAAKQVRFSAPKIPYLSNVTGTWIKEEEVKDPGYWAKHLCQTVRFADEVKELQKDTGKIFVEIGPGQSLCSLVMQNVDNAGGTVVLPTLRHAYDRQDDTAYLLGTLGKLWLEGKQIDWKGFYADEKRNRIPLPTYPFEKKRYWIGPGESNAADTCTHKETLEKKPDMADWFYTPSWKRTMLPGSKKPDNKEQGEECWLVFTDGCGVGEVLSEKLRKLGHKVAVVREGERFQRLNEQIYELNPKNDADYNLLVKDLKINGITPCRIVHMWSVTPKEDINGEKFFEEIQYKGAYSLVYLAQALGKANITEDITAWIITNGVYDVTGEDMLCPEKATILGPSRVIPQEYLNITCRNIDIVLNEDGEAYKDGLAGQLAEEFSARVTDVAVAYRGNYRWTQTYEPIRLEADEGNTGKLRDGGVYLITGGLGMIGTILSEYIARTVKCKLILIGRTVLPERTEWSGWLAVHPDDEVSKKIKKVAVLEELGAEVMVASADAADEGQMREVVKQSLERFGAINGVIHAAGIVGEKENRPIQETGLTEFGWHYRPKVYGLYVLEKILAGMNLDFYILISSLSPLLGGLAHTAYASANASMDAFIRKNKPSVKAGLYCGVNWESWYSKEDIFTKTGIGATLTPYSIAPDEGMDIFKRVLLLNGVTQVIVSTGDLFFRLDQWVLFKHMKSRSQKKRERTVEVACNENIRTSYVAPRNEIEIEIANIIGDLLGIGNIGVYDNFFFDLGGHSLLGTQLILRLKEAFRVDVSLRNLFESPNVEGLSLIIAKKLFDEIGQDMLLEFEKSTCDMTVKL